MTPTLSLCSTSAPEPDLFDYQRIGATFLSRRKAAALYDGMRLGKTRQFLKAARMIGASNIGLVAKASGVYVWEQEALEWGFDPVILKSKDKPLSGRFNIMSYNTLISPVHTRLMNHRFDLVGGDEADAFKNFKAKRTKAFYGPKMTREGGLTGQAEYNWVMTGTPVLNNPAELWPVFHALFPDAIARGDDNPMTYWQFVNRYCVTRDNGFGIQIIGGKNLPELREKMMGRVLRRTKEKVWKEWKETAISLLPVDGNVKGIPGSEMEAVRDALKSSNILEALKKAAEQAPTLRRLTGMAKVKGTLEWVHDNIEQAGKIIIFAQHKDVIEALRNGLQGRHVAIIGGMSSEQKKDAYNAFQEDPSVKFFVGQNQAARDSIPLWKSSTTILVEPDWVPGNNDQMMDRMVHFSKHEPCVGYFATLHGSVDEDIMGALRTKTKTTKGLGL